MAELMVAAAIGALASATITEVVKRSFTFLGHQLSLIRGVDDMMDKIKMDLMSIQSLLCFADQKMHQQKQVRGGESTDDLLVVWVKKVRDVAYKLQIILDTHMYGISNRGEDGIFQRYKRYRRKLRILATYRETAVELEKIGPSVKEIMDTYNTLIHQKLLSYLSDVCESSSSSSREPRNVSLTRNRFSEDGVFFSLNEKGDSQKDIIEKWILEQPAEFADVIASKLDVRWMCIALWGMGGLGKTTLLRQIYYHNIPLMKQFNCTAWVTVSKTYKVVDLLSDMIKELASSSNLDTSSKSEEELISIVHGILDKKRYLIVFDDVWQDDFWSKIEYIFSKDHDRRSRILFTTRDKNVALSVAKENRVMELQSLQEKEAWLLFCKEAFWQEIESQCPPELEELAKKIVGKCGGLPLAIVAAAGMMSKMKRNTSDWERSYRMLSSQLSDNPKLSILMHSYYALPSFLKKCFLHLSTFPEDYIYSMEMICRLWVAEGFVEEKGGMTLEEVAEGYLSELLQRSMIQQMEDQFCKILYKVHDTFRMMALDMATDQISATILDGEHQNSNDCRRLNVHKYEEGDPAIVNLESLCSLSFFCEDIPATMFPFKNFKLLKVLNFENTMLSNIPEEIFNLFNLQYLNFCNTRINVDIFPRKLARLQNLQYLDLEDTNVQQLPPDVINIHKLRHLLFGSFRDSRGFQAHMDISKLTDLQTLYLVEANEKFVKRLGQLEQLRHLGITNVKQSHEKSLCDSLKRLRHLRRLDIHISNGDLIDLELLSFSSFHLQEFYLIGGLKSIPTCFRSLNNLKRLILWKSKLPLESNPLECLRSLPCLEYLFLSNSYETPKIIFPPNCFPSLRYLYIAYFANLTSIEVDKAALPVLRTLVIKKCLLLRKPLPRVDNLQNLQELELMDMPSDVVEYFQEICDKCTNLKLMISTDEE